MAKRRDYAFVRSYASLGRDVDDLLNLINAGYSGALFDYNDPYLSQAVANAKKAGVQYGIWGDPNAVGNDPVAFAQKMAQAYQLYNPALMVPDIEFVGKGYQGSQGWDWNKKAAQAWQQYLPGARTAVTVMPNQQDFNYEAWQGLGDTEWLPQAYGANPRNEVFDPQQIVQTLIDRGVDPRLISPILGPGHTSGYEGSGLWTLDDFIGRAIPKVSGPANTVQGTAVSIPGMPTTIPRKARLSQSQEQVASGGLKWGGQTYVSPQQFINEYLRPRNQSYKDWAAEHPFAAKGLASRGQGARGLVQ